jgi:hypothetical protein
MNFKNIFIGLLIIINLVFLGYFIFLNSEGFSDFPDTFKKIKPKTQTLSNAPISYQTPQKITFAGEQVPLDNPPVFERFDEALARLAYRHAFTSTNLKKAARWFPQIEPILKKNNIPDDFKYIAVVESNLANMISSKGAVGFWQFMPETGKEYGLEINDEIDERYDPIKSTNAASKYFLDAYKKFKNWGLVAASYNMGMRGLSRRIEQQKVNSYFDLYLNPETGAYVYYVLATKYIFEHPEEFGYEFTQEQGYPIIKCKTVDIQENIPDLAIFAKSKNISYFTLKSYNPWLRQNTLTQKDSNKIYQILIPE